MRRTSVRRRPPPRSPTDGAPHAARCTRESIAAAAEPLPTTFLTALHVVGDESCLEAIAAAYNTAATMAQERRVASDDASSGENLELWLQQLTAAFQAIVKREKVARNAATMTRIANRWPEAA